jgi:hypothetical protein
MLATIDRHFYGYGIGCIRNFNWYSSRVWRSVGCRRVYLAVGSFWLEDWVRIGKLRERSTRVYTVDDEDIRSSGLVQVNDGLHAEVPLWCASEPIARRRIGPVCLEALWLQEWEWLPQEVVLEEFYRSECSGTVRVGRVRVFEGLLAVFNSCVLNFECNKVPSWIEPTSTLQYCMAHVLCPLFRMSQKLTTRRLLPRQHSQRNLFFQETVGLVSCYNSWATIVKRDSVCVTSDSK